jgi:uncharacterized metal-binding protein YceD (DUF177 family)
MGNPLRDRRPLAELADKGQVIEITEKISDFGRLAGIIDADLAALDPDKLPRDWHDSAVTGRLAFGYLDAQKQLVTLEGEVAVTIDAVCQRCLEPFRLALSVMLRVMPITTGQSRAGGEEFEVWELDDATLRPVDIVEEALIMAMPLSAMHDTADTCREFGATASDTSQTTRPFATLKKQIDENRSCAGLLAG